MPKGLKINTHTNKTLYNSTLIAVVDYHQDQAHDKNKEQNTEKDKFETKDNIRQDKMHLDKIASLAQKKFNNNNKNYIAIQERDKSKYQKN
jgi:hypothetical protein